VNDQQRIDRGRRVKSMLTSDEWVAAWNAYRALLVSIIETTEDDAKALEARRMLRAATAARLHLETLITDGTLATAHVASLQSRLRIA